MILRSETLRFFGPVASHFHFDLVVFSQIAYQYRLHMRIFVTGAGHLHRDLTNLMAVTYHSRLDLACFVPVRAGFC